MLFVGDGEYLRLSHDEFDDTTNALHGECNQMHAERTTKNKGGDHEFGLTSISWTKSGSQTKERPCVCSFRHKESETYLVASRAGLLFSSTRYNFCDTIGRTGDVNNRSFSFRVFYDQARQKTSDVCSSI